tara:strand:- start:116 stop:526 length:411 start_codon:yes stop_codon:yes gene_type:complete
MQSVIDLIPNTVYGKEDLKLYVSTKIQKAYITALGGFAVAATSNAGVDNKGTTWYAGQDLSFGGVPIFVAPGITDDTMIAAETSNLFFGLGLLNDYNEVRTIDQTPITGSQNVRIIMRFTAAAQIGIGANVVYYAA